MKPLLVKFSLFSLLASASAMSQSYYVANDQFFSEQWNLHSNGPFSNKDGRGNVNGGDHAHVAEAWQVLMEEGQYRDLNKIGEKVRIAFIDDGFDLHHEDLKGKYLATKNFADPVIEGNLFSQSPRNFHGTLVTGIAAAWGDNGVGISGACPGCKIIAARMSAEVPEGLTQDQYLEQIFDWVIAQKPDIINCSWGPGEASVEFYDKLVEKLKKGRRGKGIVLIAAAGNDGKSLENNPMANHPYTITVGGSDSSGQRQGYSRVGEGLDILAPSSAGKKSGSKYIDRLYTTDNYLHPKCLPVGKTPSAGCSDDAGWSPKTPMAGGDGWYGQYSYRFSHTSAAAPLVSGIVGLMMTANKNLSADEIQTILQQTADKIDDRAADYDTDGWSRSHGYGRVNAVEAVMDSF